MKAEIELQAGYLYEYMRAHQAHINLVKYNPDRLLNVKQQGIDHIIDVFNKIILKSNTEMWSDEEVFEYAEQYAKRIKEQEEQ